MSAVTGRGSAGRRPRSGLTLVELLVVLGIMGAAAAVVVPALRPPATSGAHDVASSLAALYGVAEREALARGVPVTVIVELHTGSYAVVAAREWRWYADTLRTGTLPLGAAVILLGGRSGWTHTTFDELGRSRGDALFVVDERVRAGSAAYEVRADPWSSVLVIEKRDARAVR